MLCCLLDWCAMGNCEWDGAWEITRRPTGCHDVVRASRLKRGRQINIAVGTTFLPLFCRPHESMLLSLRPHRWIAARNALQFGACCDDPMSKPCCGFKERPITRLNLDGGSQMRLREGAARRRMVESLIEQIVLLHLDASTFTNSL